MRMSNFEKDDVILIRENEHMHISIIDKIRIVSNYYTQISEKWYTLIEIYPNYNHEWTWDEVDYANPFSEIKKLYTTKKRGDSLLDEFQKKYPEYFV